MESLITYRYPGIPCYASGMTDDFSGVPMVTFGAHLLDDENPRLYSIDRDIRAMVAKCQAERRLNPHPAFALPDTQPSPS